MRKNADYKNHMNSYQHRFEEDNGDLEKRKKHLYKYMTSIDYTQKWASKEASFYGELTYTILDQCLAQEIKTTSFSFTQLMPDEQKRLIFCIFGNGETFLRMLV